jgi:hypothetical protein
MSLSTSTQGGFTARFARWWENLTRSRRAMAELDRCGTGEMQRIAHDVGLTGTDLSVLAAKRPNAANLLYRRMDEIKLEPEAVAKVDLPVLRDLQRVCTLCRSKSECAHALARTPSDPAWKKYCPNAMTLTALVLEQSHQDAGAGLPRRLAS